MGFHEVFHVILASMTDIVAEQWGRYKSDEIGTTVHSILIRMQNIMFEDIKIRKALAKRVGIKLGKERSKIKKAKKTKK